MTESIKPGADLFHGPPRPRFFPGDVVWTWHAQDKNGVTIGYTHCGVWSLVVEQVYFYLHGTPEGMAWSTHYAFKERSVDETHDRTYTLTEDRLAATESEATTKAEDEYNEQKRLAIERMEAQHPIVENVNERIRKSEEAKR